MWTAVVVMAVAVIFEPIRIGLGVLMLNRPRPLLQLAVFLCGGFAMGIGVGLAVLFLLRTTPLVSTDTVSVAGVQIAVGVAVLMVAAWIAVAGPRGAPTREPAIALAGNSTGPTPGGAVTANDRSVRGWVRRTLKGDSLWVAWVAGMSTALPSANYLGAMAVILASGAAGPAQALALVVFNVIAFALIELPLLSYLVAPQRTLGFMAALHTWLATRPKRDIAALVAASGCVVLVIGLARL